jgi:transcriptional regulator with XRE-family HTH domain
MNNTLFTPEQIRAARSLIHWSQNDLAEKAGVAVSTVADFERGYRVPVANNALAIRRALEMAGVVFTEGGVSQGFQWTLMTEGGMSLLNVTFQPENSAIVLELASIFGEVEPPTITISGVQCATLELKKKLTAFVEKHGATLRQANRLKKTITNLSDGAFFLFLPMPPSSCEEQLLCERLIHQLNHPGEATYEAEQEEFFGRLLREYDLTIPRTDKRFEIGNPRKQDRTCRFCHRTVASNARFDKEAHAIPAALGNKYLKLNDECDDCNEHFGNNVEPTLVELLNIQRIFLGIKARSARPTVQFSGGTMFHDGERVVIASENISKDAAGVLSAQLGKERWIVPMRFYQALAKIALSVIPDEELPSLKRTVAWVRFNESASKRLPPVASAVVPLPPDPSAQITVYVRRRPESRLPHVVCEFRLGCYLYVFVLPFSDKDNWDIVGFFEDETFKDIFRHYSHVGPWGVRDYSSANEVPLVQNIKLFQQESSAAE